MERAIKDHWGSKRHRDLNEVDMKLLKTSLRALAYRCTGSILEVATDMGEIRKEPDRSMPGYCHRFGVGCP